MWEYIPGEVYDAAYMVSMADGTTNIEWNISTLEGRINDPVFYRGRCLALLGFICKRTCRHAM